MSTDEPTDRPGRRAPRPLNAEMLQALALRYVGRYATTRAKLRAYLKRKVEERGWAEESRPDLEHLVSRFAELRYVDDEAFATMRGAALTRRGYGKRRVDVALRAAGVSPEDGAAASDAAETASWDSALALARRKRLGPFAAEPHDRIAREKAIATLVRGGHDYALARKVATMSPEEIEGIGEFS